MDGGAIPAAGGWIGGATGGKGCPGGGIAGVDCTGGAMGGKGCPGGGIAGVAWTGGTMGGKGCPGGGIAGVAWAGGVMGSGGGIGALALTGFPQTGQKRASGVSWVPQDGHVTGVFMGISLIILLIREDLLVNYCTGLSKDQQKSWKVNETPSIGVIERKGG